MSRVAQNSNAVSASWKRSRLMTACSMSDGLILPAEQHPFGRVRAARGISLLIGRRNLLPPFLDARLHVLRLGDHDTHRSRCTKVVEQARRECLRWFFLCVRHERLRLAYGHYLELVEGLDGALRAWVEVADRLDGVANELDPHRRRFPGGIHVEDPAAQ